jgi:thiosulfate/3-mercaptopyruvate sulfurtransferase
MRRKVAGSVALAGLGLFLLAHIAYADQKASGYKHPELLVETEWVAEHGTKPEVRLMDLRSEAAYQEGHIPGAAHLPDRELRNAEDKETYLPGAEKLAALLGGLGIDSKTHIVAYDDVGGRNATRLWYVLRVYGHTKFSLVNGGWLKWKAEGRAVSQTPPTLMPMRFRARPTPKFSCPSTAFLKRASNIVVLDARTDGEYNGTQASPGAQRTGRVPGAVHIDWQQNVTGTNKVFKSAEELRALYIAKGITPDKEIVAYCASGGRASHSFFALTLLGYPKVRLYYGSFSDYSARPGAPVEK